MEGKNYEDLYGNPDNKQSKRYLHAKVLNEKAVLYCPGVTFLISLWLFCNLSNFPASWVVTRA